jgi:prepilin-type N-terminal cleavage/methylation domain-containing protein
MPISRAGGNQGAEVPRQAGVTLLELIVVMAILSLMLGLVAPRFGTWMDNWKLRSAAERIAQTLRDLRTRAIYEQRYYVVEIGPAEGQASAVSRVRTIEPVSGQVREYTLPVGIRVDEGEEAPSCAMFRMTVYPSGGMEERTLRLRNQQGREVDVHINLLLSGPEIEIATRKP